MPSVPFLPAQFGYEMVREPPWTMRTRLYLGDGEMEGCYKVLSP